MIKIRKIEAWATWYGEARSRFAGAVVTDLKGYESVLYYFGERNNVISVQPQRELTGEDAMEAWMESDYEVIVLEYEREDGTIIKKQWLSPGESSKPLKQGGI